VNALSFSTDATASALSAEIFPSPAGELILYRPTFRK
jgi:hypothetical protein